MTKEWMQKQKNGKNSHEGCASLTRNVNCIGLDFGLRYCGIAIGQQFTRNARPLTILKAINGAIAMHQLDTIIHTYEIKTLVVGIMTDSVLANIVLSFSKLVGYRHPAIKICFIEETGTSKAAQLLIQRRHRDDAIAASCILEHWFNDIER